MALANVALSATQATPSELGVSDLMPVQRWLLIGLSGALAPSCSGARRSPTISRSGDQSLWRSPLLALLRDQPVWRSILALPDNSPFRRSATRGAFIDPRALRSTRRSGPHLPPSPQKPRHSPFPGDQPLLPDTRRCRCGSRHSRSIPTLDHSCSTASVLGRSPRPVPVLGGTGWDSQFRRSSSL
jgi:hypothetical protein